MEQILGCTPPLGLAEPERLPRGAIISKVATGALTEV